MLRDRFDLTVSCASEAALRHYEAGIDSALRFDGPGIEDLTAAVQEDPEFALAHAALSRQLFIHGARRSSLTHLKRAVALSDSVSERERRAIHVMHQAAKHSEDSTQLLLAHIDDYPRDVFVLSYLAGPFGQFAFSGDPDWCQQNLALLEQTAKQYPEDDWWHLTTRGFFAAEAGDLDVSRAMCERAWSIDQNGNCAHSLAHCQFEMNASEEGRQFIDAWLAQFGDQSDMRHHMVWHLTLLDIEDCRPAASIAAVFDRELAHEVCDPMPLTTFSDNASFHWRLRLADTDLGVDARRSLWTYAERTYPRYGLGFVDLHRVIAAVLHPDRAILDECQEKLRACAAGGNSATADVITICADGFAAYHAGCYAESAAILEPILASAVTLGGSNPQRRIIEDTYLDACVRCARHEAARKIVAARNRPNSLFDQRLQEAVCNRG